MNQKKSVPVKIRAPVVKNSVLQQSRIVTRLNVWIAASGSMGSALCVVIGVILVVRNLFEKNKKNK
jgi:negative regulator of sigma E activity